MSISRERHREVLLVLCLCTAAAIPFLPVLNAEFASWDDDVTVSENPFLRMGLRNGLIPLLSRGRAALYVPVTYTVYWLEAHLWGINSAGFHLANLLVHTANILLVYLIFRRLLPSRFPALAAALWWGVHPLNVEAVAWVTGLKDVLSALLMFASVLLYMTWRERCAKESEKRSGKWLWAASLVAFGLACLSKPSAVALPLALVGYDIFVARRSWRALRATLPYFAVSLAVAIVTSSVQRTEELGVPAPNWIERPRVVADAVMFYIGKFLWPKGLCAIYAKPIQTVVHSRWSSVALIGTIMLLGIAFLQGKRWRFAMMLFIAGIAPVSGLVPFGYQRFSTVADRYVYFSGVGLALILGDLASRFGDWRAKRLNKWGAVAVSCLVLWAFLLSLATWKQTPVWKDSLTLWEHAVKTQPDSAVSHNNRGYALDAIGEYKREIEDYTSATQLDPSYPEAFNNLGALQGRLGDHENAIANCTHAIELKPNYAEAYNNRGTVWQVKVDYAKAIQDYTQAITIDPYLVEPYYNRGVCYAATGKYDLAIKDYTQAIEFGANLPDPYFHRGVAWSREGNDEQAIQDFSRAIELNPKYADAYNNRATVYYILKKYDKAWEDVNRCRALGGQVNPDFIEHLQERSGRTE